MLTDINNKINHINFINQDAQITSISDNHFTNKNCLALKV